jgi:hypothetical protein
MRTKPSIAELVESYLIVGIPKARAVRYIFADNMERRAPGKGNQAAKRGAKVREHKLAAAWAFEDAFNGGGLGARPHRVRVQRNRARCVQGHRTRCVVV